LLLVVRTQRDRRLPVEDGRRVRRLAAHFASICSDPDDVQSFVDDVLRPFLRVRVSDSDGSRLVRQVNCRHAGF